MKTYEDYPVLIEDTSKILINPQTGEPYYLEPDRPIKLVYEGAIRCELNDDGDLIISHKLTPFEIADLFGVDVVDILDGKIGIYTFNEEEENEL